MRLSGSIVGVALLISAFHVSHASAHQIVVTECRTIEEPGFYILTKNLTATGDCLIIHANLVTLDLGGFLISGTNRKGTGIGSGDTFVDGVVIRNGSVTGFTNGVLIQGRTNTVERIRATNNSNTGIAVIGVGPPQAGGAIVEDNVALLNDTGIATRGLVYHNTASINRIGIFVDKGSSLIENIVQFNTEFGFQIRCPTNLLFNTATNTQSGGSNNIFLFPETRNVDCGFDGNRGANFTD